ncbi:hypothetical protein N7478_012042 [Penicillium angulare]|uniref:uncharacterized protein n=1 Tax=Penicillium angulare TaxID=116970 RepID=UPI002541AEF1|nr:uncharacterized protein N7478_012042 [Penicillium angulare]KAJ5261447.1 hypothetical protein N7478_012042 [Penicillium angulare]
MKYTLVLSALFAVALAAPTTEGGGKGKGKGSGEGDTVCDSHETVVCSGNGSGGLLSLGNLLSGLLGESCSGGDVYCCKQSDVEQWGPPEIAAAKALQETVHAGNEQLFRTYHRSLASCLFVYDATKADDKNFWVVSAGPDVPMYDTHAGGREIHIHPEFFMPRLSQVYSGSRKDPLRDSISPRRFLSASDLEALHRFFPAAIGARVLISGFIIVLFRKQEDIEASWLEGCVPSFGLLRLGYDIAVHFPTETIPESGNAVAESPGQGGSVTPLGLKLKFADGSEGITVSTHSFVDSKTPFERSSHKGLGLLSRTKSAFSRATALKVKECVRSGSNIDSSLGKSKIGSISITYDHHIAPSAVFPQTIEHNVSIVTGDRLPNILNPPGTPKITGWGSYRDALDGHFAFAMDLSAWGKYPEEENHHETVGCERVVVEGVEYLWDRNSRTQSAALLWRAVHDEADEEGLSRSVLCLGQPNDDYCRAVALKHFETPICHQHLMCDRISRNDVICCSLKGGFLLPPELGETEIVCDSGESSVELSEKQTWGI